MDGTPTISKLAKFLERFCTPPAQVDEELIAYPEWSARIRIIPPNQLKSRGAFKDKSIQDFDLNHGDSKRISANIWTAIEDSEQPIASRFFVYVYEKGKTAYEAQSDTYPAPYRVEEQDGPPAPSGNMDANIGLLERLCDRQQKEIETLHRVSSEKDERIATIQQNANDMAFKFYKELSNKDEIIRKIYVQVSDMTRTFGESAVNAYGKAIDASRVALEVMENSANGGGFELPKEITDMIPGILNGLPAAMAGFGGGAAAPAADHEPHTNETRRVYFAEAVARVSRWQTWDHPFNRQELAGFAMALLELADKEPDLGPPPEPTAAEPPATP